MASTFVVATSVCTEKPPCELVVEAGHWYAGKTIQVLTENVTRISRDDSTVFVNLTMDDIRRTTRNDVAQPEAASR